MAIESLIAEGDMVAVRVRSAGTNRGKLGGFAPPTNKRFVAQQSHWYRVADGKLCKHWATRDDLSAMLQLGDDQASWTASPAGPGRRALAGAHALRDARALYGRCDCVPVIGASARVSSAAGVSGAPGQALASERSR